MIIGSSILLQSLVVGFGVFVSLVAYQQNSENVRIKNAQLTIVHDYYTSDRLDQLNTYMSDWERTHLDINCFLLTSYTQNFDAFSKRDTHVSCPVCPRPINSGGSILDFTIMLGGVELKPVVPHNIYSITNADPVITDGRSVGDGYTPSERVVKYLMTKCPNNSYEYFDMLYQNIMRSVGLNDEMVVNYKLLEELLQQKNKLF